MFYGTGPSRAPEWDSDEFVNVIQQRVILGVAKDHCQPTSLASIGPACSCHIAPLTVAGTTF